MGTPVIIMLSIAAAILFVFSPEGSGQYMISIVCLLFSVWWLAGSRRAALALLGFVCWHFSFFGSESMIQYLLLPGAAVVCFSMVLSKMIFGRN